MKPNAYRLVGRVLNKLLDRRLWAASRYEFPLLVHGESGVGKEIVAWQIAQLSNRRDGPYRIYNCGVDHDLVASELFGYLKGAFTGAIEDRMGIIESAHRGFVFLDEIDKLPKSAQALLLRVLSTSTIRRIGAVRETPVDVRFIAATNADLLRRAREGAFSEDLYHRLSGLTVSIPPLRERREDIPELIEHFLAARARPGEPAPRIEREAIEWLTGRPSWSGNVRELEQWVEACWASYPGDSLSIEMARAILRKPSDVELTPELVESTIREHGGNRAKAARELGISRPTLYKFLGL